MTLEERERIGDLLIEEGILTQEEVQEAIAQSTSAALSGALGMLRCPRRAELAAWLAADFVTPKIDDLRKVNLSSAPTSLISADLARRLGLLPLASVGGVLCVARSGPFNRAGIQELRKATGLKVTVIVAEEAQVLAAIEAAYGDRTRTIPAPGGEAAAPAKVEEPVEALPLISMSGGEDRQAPAPRPMEAMAAARVTKADFEAEERHPFVQLIRGWDLVFVLGKPVHPVRVG